MSVRDVADRVNFAEEIHSDSALSKLIQRRLEGKRATQIAKYLADTKERFFNSMVLATYGGTPEWLEVGNFKATSKIEIVRQIPEAALDSFGFLSLDGSARIFALDGQHRLAGIRKALVARTKIEDDQVPVIFVAHKKTKAGLERTRRLFTTLNKMAVAVNKADIIALDEDDAMAIVTRRLVEENPAFRDPKILVGASTSIPVGNRVCLTTISKLYDILKLLFIFDTKQRAATLRFNRPSDERLEHFYDVATSYFNALGEAFKPVGDLFATTQPRAITEIQRGSHGGHLLFRSDGLDIFTQSAIALARKNRLTLPKAVARLRDLPVDLANEPYKGVIWDAMQQRFITKGKKLARDLVFYMVGLPIDTDVLSEAYSRALGSNEGNAVSRLPARII